MKISRFVTSVFRVAASLWGTAALFALLPGQLRAQSYNYQDALTKGILFYDANRCGGNVTAGNAFTWRGNCHGQDQSLTGGVDLTGGYHDAGDYLKMGLNQGFSASLLGWSLYEYRGTYDATGNTTKMLSTLKVFTDYFLKCHPNSGIFWYEVGLDSDHDTWRPPENDSGVRTCPNNGFAYWADATHAASDICGETAAALALMSLNYQGTDAAYAAQCLQAAKEIYALGKAKLGVGRSNAANDFYTSSGYYDHLAWGALWLNIATGTASYRTDAQNFLASNTKPTSDPLGWDSVLAAANLKLYQLTGTTSYKTAAQASLNAFKATTKTPGGLVYYTVDDPLVYTISESFIAYHYTKLTGDTQYKALATTQLNYVLGTNPRNSSYVVGFGSNWPVHVQHAAANGYVDNTMSGTSAWNNVPKHELTGAMVGGPSATDTYQDNVANYQQSEPAIDYNAGFVALVAAHLDSTGLTTVAAPAFSPGAGTYTSAQTVTITSATSGAFISYTTDGTTPDSSTNGTVYTAPVAIGSTTTLKAMAYKSGLTDSGVTSALYTISPGGGGGVTATAGDGLHTTALSAAQSSTFTAEFDWTSTASPINSLAGLSSGTPVAYTGLAVIVRFNPSGNIDARNGGAYAAASTIPYSAGVSYHFRLVVNVAAHTYSAYVTPAGGSELTIGANYAFRTEQAAVTGLTTWSVAADPTPAGSTTVTSFTLPAAAQVATPGFSPAGGTYTGAQSVAITSATSGATIRYTTDGSTPTSTTGAIYSAAVNIAATTTLKAIAYKSGLTDSAVAAATYTITGGTPAKFTFAGTAVTDSTHTGSYVPANTVDGSLSTRWAASGNGVWIQYDLGSSKTVSYVKLAFYLGNARTYTFDVQVSTNGTSWTNLLTGQTNAANTALQTFDFTDATARYVRIVGHLSSVDAYTNLTETEVWGF